MWSDSIFDLVFDAINIVYIDSLWNTCIYFDKTCPSIPVKFIDQIKARGATIIPSPLSSVNLKPTQSLVVLTGPFHPLSLAITPPKSHEINFQLPINSIAEYINTCDIQKILLGEMKRKTPAILPINDSAMLVLRSGVKGSRQIRDYLGIMRIGSVYLRGKKWMRDMGVLEDDPLGGCIWQIKMDYPIPKIPIVPGLVVEVDIPAQNGTPSMCAPYGKKYTQPQPTSATSTTHVQFNVAISVSANRTTTSTYTSPSNMSNATAGPSRPPPYQIFDPARSGISSSTLSGPPGLDTFCQAGPSSMPTPTNFAPFSANTIPLPLPTPAPYPRYSRNAPDGPMSMSERRKRQHEYHPYRRAMESRMRVIEPEQPYVSVLFGIPSRTIQVYPDQFGWAGVGVPRITVTRASPEKEDRELAFDYTAPPVNRHRLHPPPIGFTRKDRNQIWEDRIMREERKGRTESWVLQRKQEEWGVWW